MSRKIVRVLGKRGRITIPYEIRVRNKIGYNDILSFEEKDANTIILKKERLCGGCTPQCFDEANDISIEDFLDNELDTKLAKVYQTGSEYEIIING